MNTVSNDCLNWKNDPKNLAAAYKRINGGEVSETILSGGAGDASLSPSHVRRHTPALSLGAVHGPAIAPGATKEKKPDPLTPPGLVRFLLGPTASAALAQAGEYFTIQAEQSKRPEDAGRFILLALPVSKDVADSAARVAQGSFSAERKRRNVTPPLS